MAEKKQPHQTVKPVGVFDFRLRTAHGEFQAAREKAEQAQTSVLARLPLIGGWFYDQQAIAAELQRAQSALVGAVSPLEFSEFAGLGGLLRGKPRRTMAFAGTVDERRASGMANLLLGPKVFTVYQEAPEKQEE